MKNKNIFKTMQKGRSIIVACLLLVLLLAGLSSCTGLKKTDIVLDNLNVEAVVHADGSATIVETYDAVFNGRKKDWWNFNHIIAVNGNSFANIPTNAVSITASVDGINYPMFGEANLDSGNYTDWQNVLSGKSYFYKNGDKTEIGVVMPTFHAGTRNIVLKYEVKQLVTRYEDANAFYYQFVPSENTMSIKNLKVKVDYPQSEMSKTFAWLHLASGNGGLRINESTPGFSNNLEIEAVDIPAGMFVETRLMLPQSIFTNQENLQKNDVTLASVQATEQGWFDDFQKEVSRKKTLAILDIVFAVLAVVVAVVLLLVLLRIKKPKTPENAPEYLRDIPTDWTVEEAASVYWYYKGKDFTADMMSATIMKLIKNYYVEIKTSEKKKEAVLCVKNTDKSRLTTYEGIVLGLLEQVCEVGQPFTMKDFENWSHSNAQYVSSQITTYESNAKQKSILYGAYQKTDKANKIALVGSGVLGVLGVLLLMNGLFMLFANASFTFTAIGCIVGASILCLVRRKKTPLTAKGQEKRAEFCALEKYMTDFSNLKEHEIPALILWEDYMIWATMMGVADKVAEQLDIAYPEYHEMVTSGTNADMFLLLYMFSPSMRFSAGLNFAANIGNVMSTVHSIQHAQQVSNFSNKFGGFGGGGGGGGGFSGGGGGFGGGGSMGGR